MELDGWKDKQIELLYMLIDEHLTQTNLIALLQVLDKSAMFITIVNFTFDVYMKFETVSILTATLNEICRKQSATRRVVVEVIEPT